MSLARLMDPLTLNDLLHDPQLVLLDCRFALDDADYGLRSYRAGHIAQARFVDIGFAERVFGIWLDDKDPLTPRWRLPRCFGDDRGAS